MWFKAKDCLVQGIFPQLSDAQLNLLLEACRGDSPELAQKASTVPRPMNHILDLPVESACPICFCGWKSGLTTVEEVQNFFSEFCTKIDELMGEPAACRWFLIAWDDLPRVEVISRLALAIREELNRREGVAA